ncbi:MAG: 4Fe-4S binding protein [Eggerthellaceae bacterium]|nr:4Fe-4S binding protein [Eggerthellaceae bacterium]
MTKKLLMGNEAMAHAALESGVAVVAGYPGTPSSEIVETVARQHARGAAHGVHVEWSTNEKVALELLFGASLAGKRGLFTCKQMGLNVASDALMSLNYVSVRGGLVLIVADDPGPISSQTEQDTRRFAAFAKVPVLDPSSPEQAYLMVKAAFDLSERFNTPVIVRPTTRVDHASTFLDVAEETSARAPLLIPSASGTITPGGFEYDPDRWVIFPRRAYEAHGEINNRLSEIAAAFSSEAYSQFNPMREVPASEPPRQSHVRTHIRTETPAIPPAPTFGIVASGISAAYARDALQMVAARAAEAGVRTPAYRFMQIGTPYPFPAEAVAEFSKGLAEILVIEELDYVLEDELVRFAGRTHATFNVHGKLTGEARDRGENDVDDIMARIERFLGLTGRLSLHRLRDEIRNSAFDGSPNEVALSEEAVADLPKRPPVLCAGCPHRGAFYAVKNALGDVPAVMCGDIGCYTLGNAAPLEAVDTCLCMGGGVTMAQGIAVADPGKKAIAYIGDSTFFASGMTGLANAAYNGHDITVMVLDNATTAMTGAQPHPGTGFTLMGERNEPLSIMAVLNACGFVHVYRANPFDLDQSITAVRAAVEYAGPSAVLFEGPCAQIAPTDPAPGIDTDQCTGCKRCITSIGCPAISFNANAKGPRSRDRGQAVINTSLCVGCNLCVQTCPFKAIVPNMGDMIDEGVEEAPTSAYAPTTLAPPPEYEPVNWAASGALPKLRHVDPGREDFVGAQAPASAPESRTPELEFDFGADAVSAEPARSVEPAVPAESARLAGSEPASNDAGSDAFPSSDATDEELWANLDARIEEGDSDD